MGQSGNSPTGRLGPLLIAPRAQPTRNARRARAALATAPAPQSRGAEHGVVRNSNPETPHEATREGDRSPLACERHTREAEARYLPVRVSPRVAHPSVRNQKCTVLYYYTSYFSYFLSPPPRAFMKMQFLPTRPMSTCEIFSQISFVRLPSAHTLVPNAKPSAPNPAVKVMRPHSTPSST